MSSLPSRRSTSRYRMMPLDIESFVALSSPEYTFSTSETKAEQDDTTARPGDEEKPAAVAEHCVEEKRERQSGGMGSSSVIGTRSRLNRTLPRTPAITRGNSSSASILKTEGLWLESEKGEDMDQLMRERAAVHQYGSIRFDPVTEQFLCWCSHALIPKDLECYASTEGVSCDFCGWTEWIPRKAKPAASTATATEGRQSETFVSYRKGVKRERTSSVKQEEEEEQTSLQASSSSNTTTTTNNNNHVSGRGRGGRGRSAGASAQGRGSSSRPSSGNNSHCHHNGGTTPVDDPTLTGASSCSPPEKKQFFHCDACGVDICPQCCEEVRADQRYYVPCLQCGSCGVFVRYKDSNTHVCEKSSGCISDRSPAGSSIALVKPPSPRRRSSPTPVMKRERSDDEDDNDDETNQVEHSLGTRSNRGATRGGRASRGRGRASRVSTTARTSASSSSSVTPPRPSTKWRKEQPTDVEEEQREGEDDDNDSADEAGQRVGRRGRGRGCGRGGGRGLWRLTVQCQERHVARAVHRLVEQESRLKLLPHEESKSSSTNRSLPLSLTYASPTRLAAERIGARVVLEAGAECRCTIVKMEGAQTKNDT